jgi:hypothetical protein
MVTTTEKWIGRSKIRQTGTHAHTPCIISFAPSRTIHTLALSLSLSGVKRHADFHAAVSYIPVDPHSARGEVCSTITTPNSQPFSLAAPYLDEVKVRRSRNARDAAGVRQGPVESALPPLSMIRMGGGFCVVS